MTTKTTGGTAVMTPAGARAQEEKAAGAGELEVPQRLRTDYDAAPGIDPDAYIRQMANVKDHRPSFETWAHRRRMQYAETQVRLREQAAALEARKRPCPCCGERVEILAAARAGVGLPNPAVCRDCRPVVAAAVQSRAPLPDGRARAEAADELAARLWAERQEV